MTKKLKVAVVFGGPSTEHDISIITGIQIIENLDDSKYELIPIYWTRDNKFLTCESYSKPKEILKNITNQNINVTWDVNKKALKLNSPKVFSKNKTIIPDVIIPGLHGNPGEGGDFQGLLEIFDVPYAGSSMGSSFVSMDKNVFKQLMKANNISILPWQIIEKSEKSKTKIKFKYPVIAKPNSLGSSIGVKRCNSEKDLKEALELIFELDTKAIVEPYVEDLIEINCSVLGDIENQTASVCERPVGKGEILDFKDKYMSGGKSKVGKKVSGMASLDRIIPADIPEKLSKSVQEICKEVFRIAGCAGIVRIDCIYSKKTKKLVVNEINSIPGSYSFYLWEATGKSFTEVLEEAIKIAFVNHQKKHELTKTFESTVLENFLGN
ncbi:D-alanine--D-alanine ligase [Candidatus Curtissbacteria bacterium]|nr:D-alanine--D-alanine ligase [Candidatus Curtissbacteria bacterium]